MKFKARSEELRWAMIKKNMKYYMFLVVLGLVSNFPQFRTQPLDHTLAIFVFVLRPLTEEVLTIVQYCKYILKACL